MNEHSSSFGNDWPNVTAAAWSLQDLYMFHLWWVCKYWGSAQPLLLPAALSWFQLNFLRVLPCPVSTSPLQLCMLHCSSVGVPALNQGVAFVFAPDKAKEQQLRVLATLHIR